MPVTTKKSIAQQQAFDALFPATLTHKAISQKMLVTKAWLIDRFNDPKIKSLRVKAPKIGRLYLACYNPKYRDTLPIWEHFPCFVCINVYTDGYAGLNLHYLPLNDRLALFKILTNQRNLENVNPRYAMQVTYQKLKTLSDTLWKYCYKRYLYGYLESPLLDVPPREWDYALHLPIAEFHGPNAASPYKH